MCVYIYIYMYVYMCICVFVPMYTHGYVRACVLNFYTNWVSYWLSYSEFSPQHRNVQWAYYCRYQLINNRPFKRLLIKYNICTHYSLALMKSWIRGQSYRFPLEAIRICTTKPTWYHITYALSKIRHPILVYHFQWWHFLHSHRLQWSLAMWYVVLLSL